MSPATSSASLRRSIVWSNAAETTMLTPSRRRRRRVVPTAIGRCRHQVPHELVRNDNTFCVYSNTSPIRKEGHFARLEKNTLRFNYLFDCYCRPNAIQKQTRLSYASVHLLCRENKCDVDSHSFVQHDHHARWVHVPTDSMPMAKSASVAADGSLNRSRASCTAW